MLSSVVGLSPTSAVPVGTTPLPTIGLVTDHLLPNDMPKIPRSMSGGREQRSLSSRKKSLWNKSGFNLQVLPDGTVNGTRIDTPYSLLQFVTIMSLVWRTKKTEMRVTIRGIESNHYVCMNSSGSVYGSKTLTEECRFKEDLDNKHNTYSSVTYPSKASKKRWYLAIGKDGKVRNGSLSKKNHRWSQFLPRPLSQPRLDTIIPPWIKKLPPTDSVILKTLTTPSTVMDIKTASWENCKQKNKRKCCRGLSRSDRKKCRRKYGLKGGKKKRKKNSRKRKGKSRSGKKRRKHTKKNRKST